MIDGVRIKRLEVNVDERGALTELLRRDDEFFEGFGQAYVSMNYPQVVRAWHWHDRQADFFVVVKGMVKVGLFDARLGSGTRGEVNEFFLGELNPLMVRIPPGVVHGYKTIGTEPSLLLNFPTEPYNRSDPDEKRLPWNTVDIPYDWDIKMK
jgi:dTDP-4-dehydrorhamnose 3,5-epimerase